MLQDNRITELQEKLLKIRKEKASIQFTKKVLNLLQDYQHIDSETAIEILDFIQKKLGL